MSRRRRREKKRKRPADRDVAAAGLVRLERVGRYVRIRNAATPEEFASMRRVLARWKFEAPGLMRKQSEALLELVAAVDPVVVLGFVFNRNHLMPQFAGKPMTSSYAIMEHLALLLAKEQREGGEMRIEPDESHALLETLEKQLQDAIQFTLPDLPADGSRLLNEPFRDALETIVSWELGVRVERYDHQQKALLRALFTPFADDIRARLGFTCDDAMRIETIYEERIKLVALDGAEQCRAVLADVDRILRKKSALDPANAALVADLLTTVPKSGVRMQVLWSLSLWTALRTGHSLAPTLKDLVDESGLPPEIVESVLQALTTVAKDLADYWFMLPVSPLRTMPLAQIGETYALPSPGLFLPALQTLFETTLKQTPAWEAYQQHRAAFGEEKASALFARALPGATIHRNLKYRAAAGEGEVDVMVSFGRHLFLVEVKSGDFADAARAGVESRVEETLRDLVSKAHEQVRRAETYIERVPVATFRSDVGPVEIRRTDFDQVHLISLTLEQLGHIVNNAGAFFQAGQARAPLTLSIDDLEVIADILTRPAPFLHYIKRREAYLPHPHIQNGDELGFLEQYLRTSLREDPATFGEFTNVHLDPASPSIDAFEHAIGAGEVVPLPQQQLPAEVDALLDALNESRPNGWLQASFALLGLIPRHQRLIARTLKSIRGGAKVKGVTVKGLDGSVTAHLRIDDPKALPENGVGITLVVDRELRILSLTT